MGSLVAARRLLAELDKAEELEVRRVDPLAKQLAALIDERGAPLSGYELEAWLGEHRLVEDLYVGAAELDEAVRRHFPAAFAPKAARDDVLERAICEARDELEPHQIYADWLQERGDPLGELIALAGAGDEGGFERQLKLKQGYFLGVPAGDALPEHVELGWHHGLLRSLRGPAHWGVEAWSRVLAGEACRLLERLALCFDGDPGETLGAEVLAAVAEQAPDSLRAVRLEHPRDLRLPEPLLARGELREIDIFGGTLHLPEAWPAGLERLSLRADLPLGYYSSPPPIPSCAHLRSLELDDTCLVGEQLHALESLTLHLHSVRSRTGGVSAWLATLELPRLTRLELVGSAMSIEELQQVLCLPLASKLEHLGLRRVSLDDDIMQLLAGERGKLPALQTLEVSDNELTLAGLEAASRLAPKVISAGQRVAGAHRAEVLRGFGFMVADLADAILAPERWCEASLDGDLRHARFDDDELGETLELYVSHDLQRFGCSCGSPRQPCHHVVALARFAEANALPQRDASEIEARVPRGVRTLD